MAETTGIGWTDSTWSVWLGCTKVSRGCKVCYIDRTMPFRVAGRKFDGTEPGATTGIEYHPERLSWPYRTGARKLGPRVFVNSLSDVGHEHVPVELVADMFAVMASTPWLTYQVLTKRPGPMRSKLRSRKFWNRVLASTAPHKYGNGRQDVPAWHAAVEAGVIPNMHYLVSVEDQPAAELRIPILLDTPAAVRGISAEPLVSDLDLTGWLEPNPDGIERAVRAPVAIECRHGYDVCPICDGDPKVTLDWVIVGGESGPGAEPMHPQWALDLIEQCQHAGVATWMKQFGGWRPAADDELLPADGRHTWLTLAGRQVSALTVDGDDMTTVPMIWSGANAHNDKPERWPEAFRVQQYPTDVPVPA